MEMEKCEVLLEDDNGNHTVCGGRSVAKIIFRDKPGVEYWVCSTHLKIIKAEEGENVAVFRITRG